MPAIIAAVYLTVIAIALIGRIIWWIFISDKHEQFLPEDAVFFGVAAWPLIFVLLIVFAVCWIATSPFVLIRNLRLNRRKNKV